MSSNSPKKQTNKLVIAVKTNSFIRFWGKFEDTKSPFEIIWPLEAKAKILKASLLVFLVDLKKQKLCFEIYWPSPMIQICLGAWKSCLFRLFFKVPKGQIFFSHFCKNVKFEGKMSFLSPFFQFFCNKILIFQIV